MTLRDFLVLLSGVGVVAAISWIVEYFQLFATAAPKTKQLIFFAICIVVGVGSQLIINFVSPAVIDSLSPYFGTIAIIFANLFLIDKFHQTTKLP
jgi:predicted tellurium resistance membrane protein TerC